MSAEVFRPAEAAMRLGVAGNTLRVYAAKFAPLLSPGATRQSGEPGRRHYSIDDLAILVRAKQLLESGSTYSQALARLAGAQTGQANPLLPPPQTPEDSPGLTAIQEALTAWRALAEDRGREVAALRARISELEQIVVGLSAPLRTTASRTPSVKPRRDGSSDATEEASTASAGGASEGEALRTVALPGEKAPGELARRHVTTGGADAVQPRWWNRLFPGEPDQPGRDRG